MKVASRMRQRALSIKEKAYLSYLNKTLTHCVTLYADNDQNSRIFGHLTEVIHLLRMMGRNYFMCLSCSFAIALHKLLRLSVNQTLIFNSSLDVLICIDVLIPTKVRLVNCIQLLGKVVLLFSLFRFRTAPSIDNWKSEYETGSDGFFVASQ